VVKQKSVKKKLYHILTELGGGFWDLYKNVLLRLENGNPKDTIR
jgi:hypothetical protein